jgi:hypothetical protein
MEIGSIMGQAPRLREAVTVSLCLTCDNSRRIDDELRRGGLVGCCIFFSNPTYDTDKIEADALFKGWVDLRSRPEGERSGVITNFMLITKNVSRCPHFKERLDKNYL